MRRREFLGALSGAAALRALATGQTRPARQPNIIFILADDLGYGDLGCYGQKMFQTPEIDRLAAEGLRFTDGYAGAAVCAPSRCALMTGMHIGHARVRGNTGLRGRVPLRPDDLTVAEVLKRAGYKTGLVGKWGLGEAGTFGIPNSKGFDEFYGFLNQNHALHYYPTSLWQNQSNIFPGGNQGGKRNDYVQDLFTHRALQFIEQNRSQPFFLYLAYTIPHADSELGRNTGDGFVVPDYKPYENREWPRSEKGFAAMTWRLDQDVGRILRQVRSQGIESNTLVVFSSDNGPARDGGHTPDFFSSRGPLRGHKDTLYEGGIRVPAIARWPGQIKPGQVSDYPWAFWDFLPTAAELAGVPAPRGIDGISLAPVLLGGSRPARDYLYWESPGRQLAQAVRLGDWKGVRNSRKDPLQLYNLREDVAESRDLSRAHPDVVRRIESLMHEARVPSDEFPDEA